MKLMPSKSNTQLKSKNDIFCELIVKYIIASLATEFNNGGLNDETFETFMEHMNLCYSVNDFITSDEKEIISDIKNGKCQYTIDLSWYYEECAILMWVLNLWDFPDQSYECDVNKMSTILFYNNKNEATLPDLFLKIFDEKNNEINLNNLQMKSYEEILDKADLLNRYKWACDEAKINNYNIDLDISIPVLVNQLKAFQDVLNWDLNLPVGSYMSYDEHIGQYVIEIKNIIFVSLEQKRNDYIDNLFIIADNYYDNFSNIINFILPNLKKINETLDENNIIDLIGKPYIDYDVHNVFYML